MNRKKYFLLFSVIVSLLSLRAQNIINTYDFANLPQSIMNNPSYDIKSNYYIAIPFTVNYLDAGTSGIPLRDLIVDYSGPIEDIFKTSIYKMSSKDIFLFNQKNEVFSTGYLNDKNMFFSFGFYEELDYFSNFPKDMLTLFYEGTSQIGKQYDIDNFIFQTEMLGVYHFGIQKKINKKLRVGARFKLYSSAFNAKSTDNKGFAYVESDIDNAYHYGVRDADASVQTSGIIYDNYDFIDRDYILDKLFLTGSKGIGFDFGFTYLHDDNLSISGSIIDLGVLFNSQNTQEYSIKGSHLTDAITLDFDPDNPRDYWQEIEGELEEKINYEQGDNNYISWRPTILNMFLKYTFKKRRYAACTYQVGGNHFSNTNGIGAFLQFQKRYRIILPSVSLFYEKYFNNWFQTRISYTADRFSYANIGIITSFQVWKINLFAGVNNVFGFINSDKLNTASLQFGINVNLLD